MFSSIQCLGFGVRVLRVWVQDFGLFGLVFLELRL